MSASMNLSVSGFDAAGVYSVEVSVLHSGERKTWHVTRSDTQFRDLDTALAPSMGASRPRLPRRRAADDPAVMEQRRAKYEAYLAAIAGDARVNGSSDLLDFIGASEHFPAFHAAVDGGIEVTGPGAVGGINARQDERFREELLKQIAEKAAASGAAASASDVKLEIDEDTDVLQLPSERLFPDLPAEMQRHEEERKKVNVGDAVNIVSVAGLVLINLTFLGMGIGLASITGWALRHEDGPYGDVVPTDGLKSLTAAGFALAVVAVMGCYGALSRNRTVLHIYAACACIALAVEAVAAVVVFQFAGDIDYSGHLAAGTLTSQEALMDAALNVTYTDCCLPQPQPDKLSCRWVPAEFISLTACSDANTTNVADLNAWKMALVDDMFDSLTAPLGLAVVVLTGMQVLALIISCMLLRRVPRVTDIDDDDEDKTLRFISPYATEPDVMDWSVCFLFPDIKHNPAEKRRNSEHGMNEEDKLYNMPAIINRLQKAGLETQLFYSNDVDDKEGERKVYCKIRASRVRLEIEADRIDFRMRLDPHVLRARDQLVNKKRESEGVRQVHGENMTTTIEDIKKMSNRNPYHYIYGEYDQQHPDQAIYRKDRRSRSKFRDADVIKLVHSIIEAPQDIVPPGAGLALDKLEHRGYLLDSFAIHRPEVISVLMDRWYKWFYMNPWHQPLTDVRDYFGEKIALYFSWVGHYTKWLLAPAILGSVVWAHQLSAGTKSVTELPLFAIFTAVWATLFLEFWKRKQVTHAMEWGMVGFESTETERPQFLENKAVEEIASPVTGLQMAWQNPIVYLGKLSVSVGLILGMICVVLGCVGGIFVLRVALVKMEESGELPAGAGGGIAAGINAVQIQVLNFLYGKLAVTLNDWENHRTDTAYEDKLIAKVFWFQFVNSYFSLFWIAFIKNHITLSGDKQTCQANDRGEPDCIFELSTQLGVIFVTRLVVGNITEVLVPYIKRRLNTRREAKLLEAHGDKPAVPDKKSPLEAELAEYETFDDYAELVIQYGYVSLFVVAFPLAPAMAFFSNYVEIRVDAFKLLQNCRRPEPAGAEDIGTWYSILAVISNIAVVTNVATVIFSTPESEHAFRSEWVAEHPVWTFLIIEHAIFALKILFDVLVPDQPADVVLQIDRCEYLVTKHLQFVKDELVDLKEVEAEMAEAEMATAGGRRGSVTKLEQLVILDVDPDIPEVEAPPSDGDSDDGSAGATKTKNPLGDGGAATATAGGGDGETKPSD